MLTELKNRVLECCLSSVLRQKALEGSRLKWEEDFEEELRNKYPYLFQKWAWLVWDYVHISSHLAPYLSLIYQWQHTYQIDDTLWNYFSLKGTKHLIKTNLWNLNFQSSILCILETSYKFLHEDMHMFLFGGDVETHNWYFFCTYFPYIFLPFWNLKAMPY